MTEQRNLEKELSYWVYNDPEYGEDIENISYPALIELLGKLIDRVEGLETQIQDLQKIAISHDYRNNLGL
jgi:hypothetical protein